MTLGNRNLTTQSQLKKSPTKLYLASGYTHLALGYAHWHVPWRFLVGRYL